VIDGHGIPKVRAPDVRVIRDARPICTGHTADQSGQLAHTHIRSKKFRGDSDDASIRVADCHGDGRPVGRCLKFLRDLFRAFVLLQPGSTPRILPFVNYGER
jgi:hypothetical protein